VCVASGITADKLGKPMNTRLAMAKAVSQQKVKEKPTDATVPDSLIPVHKGASVVDEITSSEQAGACVGKADDFSIEQAPQELKDSQDTRRDLTRYQKVGTAATIDTSDTLDLDTSVCTTAGPKVTFDSLCQTNLSTIDPDTDPENDDKESDSEPTLKEVYEEYRQYWKATRKSRS